FARHHLALLGDANAAADRAGGKCTRCFKAVATAASDGPAAAMKEAQANAARLRRCDQLDDRRADFPVRGYIPAVLIAVGVADHDLDEIVLSGHQGAAEGKIEKSRHDLWACTEI